MIAETYRLGRIDLVKGWLVASLLAVLALGLALTSVCRVPVRGETLAAWGLPEDLPRRLGAVEVLQLPPTVTQTRWLPDGLDTLEVSGSTLDSPRDLPDGLQRLDLSYGAVGSLRGLPAGLEVLDLRWAVSQDLSTLDDATRAGLRVLLLAGGSGAPSFLPQGLYAYGSFDAPFDDARFLPRGLRELYLQGPKVSALRNLPPGLTVLSLDQTQVRDLSGVPDSVTSLTVHGRPLEIERWPRFLTTLSVTPSGMRWGSGSFPVSLRELRLVGSEDSVEAEDVLALNQGLLDLSVLPAAGAFLQETRLPPYLERLDLTGFEGDRLVELPGTVSELVLAYARVTDLARLPRTLTSLDLSGLAPVLLATVPDPGWPPEGLETLVYRQFPGARLVPLPPALRELDVGDSRELVDLGELPGGLERLDLSFTGLTSLPALPSSLRFLSIAGARIDSVEGRLPDGLEELVLAPGQLRRLGSVPASLRVLRFDATTGAAGPLASATGALK